MLSSRVFFSLSLLLLRITSFCDSETEVPLDIPWRRWWIHTFHSYSARSHMHVRSFDPLPRRHPMRFAFNGVTLLREHNVINIPTRSPSSLSVCVCVSSRSLVRTAFGCLLSVSVCDLCAYVSVCLCVRCTSSRYYHLPFSTFKFEFWVRATTARLQQLRACCMIHMNA